jgi:hypothetical protein
MSWLDALSESRPDPRPAPGGNNGALSGGGRGEGRAGDDFNERADWADILLPLGAVLHHETGGERYWTRPGKDRRDGYSATTGYADDADRLKVFTSHWPPFADGEVYSKFGAYSVVSHGGDHKAAAQALAQQGFGRPASRPDRSSPKAAGSGYEVPHPADLVDAAETAPAGPAEDDEAPWPDDPAPGTAGGSAEAIRRASPAIEAASGPATIRALRDAIDGGDIPGTYVSSGQVVVVERVSGTPGAVAGDEDSPLPITASEVRAPELAALLAEHTNTYRLRTRKTSDGGTELYEEEVTPAPNVLTAALARKEWPKLRPLFGIVGAPVLRPDGSLLQDPGYDPATGLYLASKVPLERVPEEPAPGQVKAAREFLLTTFLGDFPWVGSADRANYLGLLVTPILRNYLRTLIPFGVVTSTMPSSGKTILTCGLGMLYGQRVLTWPGTDEAELRKAITSVMADPVGTIIFDNLAEGTVIDSPVLARLITDRTWADRLLGGNKTAAFANDRVWTATGNNLRLGGDMRTRSVLVGLNPDMPRPEERTGFKIPDLDQWILASANQRQVLWHLLVLVADWTRADAPRRTGLTMRQFTPWAEAVGGFLAHHGVGGFLANVETVRDIDEEESTWTAFFAQWRKIHSDKWLTSNELHLSADTPLGGLDPWDGCFLAGPRGRSPGVKSIGKLLTGQINRYRGPYVLRSDLDKHSKVRTWRVEEGSE